MGEALPGPGGSWAEGAAAVWEVVTGRVVEVGAGAAEVGVVAGADVDGAAAGAEGDCKPLITANSASARCLAERSSSHIRRISSSWAWRSPMA